MEIKYGVEVSDKNDESLGTLIIDLQEHTTIEAGIMANIADLVSDLMSSEYTLRLKARSSLIAHGWKSVLPLLRSLSSKSYWKRIEQSKLLLQDHNPALVEKMIIALKNPAFNARLFALEGTIVTNNKSVLSLLLAFVDYAESLWLIEGAYIVLSKLSLLCQAGALHPVLMALEGAESSAAIQKSAEMAIAECSVQCKDTNH